MENLLCLEFKDGRLVVSPPRNAEMNANSLRVYVRRLWQSAALRRVVGVSAGALVLSGCAVSMAIEQPGKKNLDVLEVGTPRRDVLAELGVPSSTRWVHRRRVDVYRFVQGYSRGARAGRALAHGTADLLTAGVWEVAAMPAEGYFSGESLAYEVLYDDSARVLRTRPIDP